MNESFAPGVLIDGQTVHPPGWMYVFAFALRGIPWALEECEKPEFQKTMKDWLRDQHNLKLEQEIQSLQSRIEKLKEGLK